MKNESRPRLTFNQFYTPKEFTIYDCLERVEQYVPALLLCYKCKNIDATGNPVEDDRHVLNSVKRTRTIERKIAWRKLDVQIADMITRLTQELAMFTKKKIKYLRWNTRGMCLSWKKIVGTNMGENSHASVTKRADTINQGNKYRAIGEKLIYDCSKFQDHLKKLHSVNCYQAATQKVKNYEKSNEVVQAKTNIGFTTPPKSDKFPPIKQLFHKSPIRPPKTVTDRLKTLSPCKKKKKNKNQKNQNNNKKQNGTI